MESLKKETLDRIKSLRGSLSQDEFSKKVHSSQPNMSRLFSRGKASYDTLIAIANAYDVTLDWLFCVSDKKKPDGRIPPSEMTYADIISIAAYLYEIGATQEGWYDGDPEGIPQFIELVDPVLKYLFETHFQSKIVDNEMLEIWTQKHLETFSKYKVAAWPESIRNEFVRQQGGHIARREDIIHLLEHPEDYIPDSEPQTASDAFAAFNEELPF